MVINNKQSIWQIIRDFLLVTVGISLYVLAWVLFLVPNNLVGGGVSGISSIVQYATGGFIKMGYTYFVINAILLIIGFKYLGPKFAVKTIFAIVLASVGLNVLQDLIPYSFIKSIAIDNGKLISTILGGLLTGVGIGIAMQGGGSSGGTDIIALMVSKHTTISTGRMILWMDVAIILASTFIPSYLPDGSLMPFAEKVTTVVYGLVMVSVNGVAIDLYLSGSRQSVQIFIMSKKYEEIADLITGELHRGVTVLPAKGWYTKTESHVLMVITRKTDTKVLLRYIKAVDPDAFLSIASVTGVYGNGFDEIKSSAFKSEKKEKPKES